MDNNANNYLLNVSFNHSSFSMSGANSNVSVQWYLRVRVAGLNGSWLDGANISVYDKDKVLKHVASTGADGWSTRLNVTEYVQNFTGEANKTYFNNYTINVSMYPFQTASVIVNMSDNKLVYVTLGYMYTSLSAWDQEADSESFPPPPLGYAADTKVYPGEKVMFWANYTNLTNGISVSPLLNLSLAANISFDFGSTSIYSVYAYDVDGDSTTEILTT
jgi:hypothetical protein